MKFYLPSWPRPLFGTVQEQRLVHLLDRNPIVLTVDVRDSTEQVFAQKPKRQGTSLFG